MKTFSVVYVGPGISGRSTSLAQVLTTAGQRADPMGLEPHGELAFDWQLGERRLAVVATISTTRARLYYEDADDPSLDPWVRTEVDRLCRADGILFVVDRQEARCEASLDELDKLRRDLARRGVRLDTKPVVFQVNKCDLDDLCSMEWVRDNLRVKRCDYVESVATRGVGTNEAMSRLLQLILAQEASILGGSPPA